MGWSKDPGPTNSAGRLPAIYLGANSEFIFIINSKGGNLSWILHLQGLQGGVYGITTNLLMILAMTGFISGFETLINLRKL